MNMSANDAARQLLEAAIIRGQSLWQEANKRASATEDRFHHIMFSFFARSMRDCAAIHRLWIAGFGPESWVIGRAMIELELQAALLRQAPQKHADAYFIHADLMRYQSAKKAQGLVDKGRTKPLPAMNFLDHNHPEIARLAKAYQTHKHKFIKTRNPERLWENWWKGNFATLADKVRLDPKFGQSLYDEYHFAYAVGSAYVHPSEKVALDVMHKDANGFSIRHPTLGDEPSVPFQVARRFLQMSIFFDEAFQLGFKAELEGDWDAANEAMEGAAQRP